MKKETLRISAMCTKKSYEVPKNVILLDGYAYASDGQGLLRCKDKGITTTKKTGISIEI